MKTVREHLLGNLVAYIALFFAVGGATAFAVDGPLAGQNSVGSEDIIGNEVKSDDIGNGRIFNIDIADEVITGAKLKDGTVTGSDVSEDTLGKVPDADELDGIDSNGLVQGGGTVTKGAVAALPGDSPIFHLVAPDGLRLAYNCPGSDITNNTGILRIRNVGTETLNLFTDNGGENPNHYGSLGPSEVVDQSAAPSGDHFTIQSQGTSISTVEVFTVHRASDNRCHVQSQALLTR